MWSTRQSLHAAVPGNGFIQNLLIRQPWTHPKVASHGGRAISLADAAGPWYVGRAALGGDGVARVDVHLPGLEQGYMDTHHPSDPSIRQSNSRPPVGHSNQTDG